MTIKQKKFWSAVCDNCGDGLSCNDAEFDVSETKKELLGLAEDELWEVKGKKIYCDQCAKPSQPTGSEKKEDKQ